MLSLTQKQTQQQKLTPQQIQYLKMLQLPSMALEQRVKEELETNPLLEEAPTDDYSATETESTSVEDDVSDTPEAEIEAPEQREREEFDWDEFMPEGGYDEDYSRRNREDDDQEFIQPSEPTLSEQLLSQLRLQSITEEQLILAEEIIGNIDGDGYLRRDLDEIVDDLNRFISITTSADVSVAAQPAPAPTEHEEIAPSESGSSETFSEYLARPLNSLSVAMPGTDIKADETAGSTERTIEDLSLEEMATLSIDELAKILERGTSAPGHPGHIETTTTDDDEHREEPVHSRNGRDASNGRGSANGVHTGMSAVAHQEFFSRDEAEEVLHRIQRLDPPGIGARDLQECLLVQLEVMEDDSRTRRLAIRVLRDSYQEFTRKHFERICRDLDCTQEELREAIDLITSLNPKPGEGSRSIVNGNYITPDFVIERSGNDFLIIPNDRFIPPLRINAGYQRMMRKGSGGVDRTTRKFLRLKLESAKWFIASIRQRRRTMMRVMQAIVEMQPDFFRNGPDALRPMIYKDVADRIEMDISTISRVVNGKYVQTDFGVFELRYFFSEALETASGEEVSNKVVKTRIREMIEGEDKNRPLSDSAISDRMQELGFNIARRTVAKYREQMNIPVARLRREL